MSLLSGAPTRNKRHVAEDANSARSDMLLRPGASDIFMLVGATSAHVIASISKREFFKIVTHARNAESLINY